MTKIKTACVVDRAGHYVDFVTVRDGKAQYHDVNEGESIVYADPPYNFFRARWTGDGWEETGSDQEIAQWNANNGEKQTPASQIAALKKKLAETDYLAIKHSEGWISTLDYEAVRAQRQAWREEINRLEEGINV